MASPTTATTSTRITTATYIVRALRLAGSSTSTVVDGGTSHPTTCALRSTAFRPPAVSGVSGGAISTPAVGRAASVVAASPIAASAVVASADLGEAGSEEEDAA